MSSLSFSTLRCGDWQEKTFSFLITPCSRTLCCRSRRISCARQESLRPIEKVSSVENVPALAAHRENYPGAYPIPNSSTFSSGVPHLRQITAAQSPHTSG